MELGTIQVIEGTYLVEDTKKSLGQILNVSYQIDQLVQSISSATVSQARTSQAVSSLMKDLAKVSERTSIPLAKFLFPQQHRGSATITSVCRYIQT